MPALSWRPTAARRASNAMSVRELYENLVAAKKLERDRAQERLLRVSRRWNSG